MSSTVSGGEAEVDDILSVADLRVRFPLRRGFLEALRGADGPAIRAVDGVSLSLAPGEILALAGESGSGKTTTGRAILRLVDPKLVSGTVRFEGRDAYGLDRAGLTAFRRNAQVVFQDPYQSLDPRERAVDIVTEPLVVHRLAPSRAERVSRAADALETVGLRPARTFLDRYPHELSGGQRQRLAIAAALVLEPRLLVADEPVSMLDASVRASIVRLLARLREERGISLLFITHDLALAWLLADRISVLYMGRVVETGSAAEVLERPFHPYTRALADAMPGFRSRAPGERRRFLAGDPPDPARPPSGCRFRTRCPLAQALCAAEEPALRGMGKGRAAACHFAGEP